jgi:glyoxylase-like metal-dependent hydrolase (beta-lactamase superfamily II)
VKKIKWAYQIFAILVLAVACDHKQSETYHSVHFELKRLTEGVYACVHKFGGKAICNVGIVDNGKETIIFDSFLSPSVAEELPAVVQHLGLSPIRYVVNSHAHNDHIRGNQVFSREVRIISTSITAEMIAQWEPIGIMEEKKYAPQRFDYYDSLYKAYEGDTSARAYQQILMWRPYYQALAESHKVVKTRLPDVLVDDQRDLDGPDRKVQIISKGPGHTESDLILYLPDDHIVFTGDLVFNECHPYLAHGSIAAWQHWLEFLDTLSIKTVVPGHGPIGSKSSIRAMTTYIQTICDLAEKLHKDGITDEGLDSIPVATTYRDWWFDRFFVPNLKFVYNSAIAN